MMFIIFVSRLSRFSDGLSKKKIAAPTRAGVRA
jgi:hypothetical protein